MSVLRVYWAYPRGFDWRLDVLNGLMDVCAYSGIIVAACLSIRCVWKRHWAWMIVLALLWPASCYMYYLLGTYSGRVTYGFMYTDPEIVAHGFWLCGIVSLLMVVALIIGIVGICVGRCIQGEH
jgi:hypothetical protein